MNVGGFWKTASRKRDLKNHTRKRQEPILGHREGAFAPLNRGAGGTKKKKRATRGKHQLRPKWGPFSKKRKVQQGSTGREKTRWTLQMGSTKLTYAPRKRIDAEYVAFATEGGNQIDDDTIRKAGHSHTVHVMDQDTKDSSRPSGVVSRKKNLTKFQK